MHYPVIVDLLQALHQTNHELLDFPKRELSLTFVDPAVELSGS